MRRDPEATEVVYIDQADYDFDRSDSDNVREMPEIAVLTDKKKSHHMSSSKAFNKRWKQVDKEMR